MFTTREDWKTTLRNHDESRQVKRCTKQTATSKAPPTRSRPPIKSSRSTHRNRSREEMRRETTLCPYRDEEQIEVVGVAIYRRFTWDKFYMERESNVRSRLAKRDLKNLHVLSKSCQNYAISGFSKHPKDSTMSMDIAQHRQYSSRPSKWVYRAMMPANHDSSLGRQE